MSKGHVDAAAGGSFLSLSIDRATALIEKMVANQSWGKKENNKKACIP
jgi:formiminotetrahydrofolate cyclodeaminase